MYNPEDYDQKDTNQDDYQIGFEEYSMSDEGISDDEDLDLEMEVETETTDDTSESLEDTTIVSTSDSEPIENPNIPAFVEDGYDLERLDFGSQYTNPNGMGSNDQYSGTGGVNTFEYNLLLNAKSEIIAAKTEPDGRINWERITNQNENYHDHWLEGIGNDTINNFSGSGGDGDVIDISGHTVSVLVLEESDSQVVLGVYSDQSQDGFRAGGAHDLDVLGTITVNHDGNFNLGSDVKIDPMGFDGVREFGEVTSEAEVASDEPFDDMDMEEPNIEEDEDSDTDTDIDMELEPSTIDGESLEDTTIVSTSDSEPIENPNIPAFVEDGYDLERLDFGSQYTNPNGMGSNDQYSGTGGVNTFEYNLLLNAKPEIIAAKTEPDGRINWERITNQNENYHDHWLEGIGNDTINNFSGSGGDGDVIDISGHTVSVLVLEESDSQVVLGVYSDQSQDGFRAGGAHDLDVLGTITVNHDGNFNLGSDVKIDPMGFDGVREFA